MKNTIQVRKNRISARHLPQSKTAAEKPAQENVAIMIIGKNTADVVAQYDIPKSLYVAMVRSAKAKRITLEQWMRIAVTLKLDRMEAGAL